jgi:hypothetical protein
MYSTYLQDLAAIIDNSTKREEDVARQSLQEHLAGGV